MKTSQEMVYLTTATSAIVRLYREDTEESKAFKKWIRSPKKRAFLKEAFNTKAQVEMEGKGARFYRLKDASMLEVTAFGLIHSHGFKYKVEVVGEDDFLVEIGNFSQEEDYLAKYIFLLCSSGKYLDKQKPVLDQIVRNDHIKYD